MLIIKERRRTDGKFGVIDTDDNVVEYVSKAQLEKISENVLVHGFYDDCIIKVETPKDIVYRLSNCNFRAALKYCPYYYKFSLTFLPKVTRFKRPAYVYSKEYFMFRRVARDKFDYFDFNTRRKLTLTTVELLDRLVYFNDDMVFQNNSIVIEDFK
jgi:hypothetical protein